MKHKDKTQLGKLLLKQKLVKPTDLATLLDEQEDDEERLASKVVKKGLANENNLLKALSEQHGVPGINLDEVEITLSNLEIIPQDIAEKHLILPVFIQGDNIQLAMADPHDGRVIEEIEFVTGKRVFPHVALHTKIVRIIDECYRAYGAGKTVYRGSQFGLAKGKGAGITDPSEISAEQLAVVAEMPEIPEEEMEIEINVEEPTSELEAQEIKPLDLPPGQIDSSPPQKAESMAPKRSSLAAKPASAGATSISPQKKGIAKVLVVDDEEEIRLLISKVLTEKGFSVSTAARGLQAIQQVQRENPDMIILDAMLPEVHGFDICKRLKGSHKYGHIPVIMISAIYRGWRYAQDLKESYGVDDFIEKPFKVGDLVKTVMKHTKTSSAEESPAMEELSKEAERILKTGIEAYRKGNLEKAIGLMRKGIKIDPLAFKLHYHLALLLGKKGLNYQAIRELENALELDPNDFSALKNLAVLYQKAGFKFKAIETWERALGNCPDEKVREGIKQHLMNLL